MDKVICIGKNYLEHAKELGDAVPEKPVLFLKPPSAIHLLDSHANKKVPLPDSSLGEVHHECEIVVRLKRGGFKLTVEEAEEAIESVTLGLDMTLRALQGQLKKAGHPWEISKVFSGSAILGKWISVSEFGDYLDEEFSFIVNSLVRQKGKGRDMRLSPAECIAYASEYFQICPGDVVYTGTPAGVGPVQAGQSGELRWGNRLLHSFKW